MILDAKDDANSIFIVHSNWMTKRNWIGSSLVRNLMCCHFSMEYVKRIHFSKTTDFWNRSLFITEFPLQNLNAIHQVIKCLSQEYRTNTMNNIRMHALSRIRRAIKIFYKEQGQQIETKLRNDRIKNTSLYLFFPDGDHVAEELLVDFLSDIIEWRGVLNRGDLSWCWLLYHSSVSNGV